MWTVRRRENELTRLHPAGSERLPHPWSALSATFSPSPPIYKSISRSFVSARRYFLSNYANKRVTGPDPYRPSSKVVRVSRGSTDQRNNDLSVSEVLPSSVVQQRRVNWTLIRHDQEESLQKRRNASWQASPFVAVSVTLRPIIIISKHKSHAAPISFR